MKNIEKYQKLIAKGEVDALLLTSKHNRQYAAEYCIAEGVAVICKTQSYYFTDFRYIESAQKNLPGFAVKMVDTEHPYTKLINEAISDNTVKTIGFEDDTLTVEEYTLYNTKLNAVLHPYAAEINAPRASKEPWEIEYMKKAQEITDRTFDDLLNVIVQSAVFAEHIVDGRHGRHQTDLRKKTGDTQRQHSSADSSPQCIIAGRRLDDLHVQQIPHSKKRRCHLTDDRGHCRTHHTPF